MTPSGIGAEDPLGKLVASRCPGWSRGGGLAARSRASGEFSRGGAIVVCGE